VHLHLHDLPHTRDSDDDDNDATHVAVFLQQGKPNVNRFDYLHGIIERGNRTCRSPISGYRDVAYIRDYILQQQLQQRRQL